MALVCWNPYAEMDSLRRQMDRWFDEVTSTNPYNSQWKPTLEFHDNGEHFILKAQLPGLKPEDIDVSVRRDRLTISGEYRQEQQDKTHSEFYYGSFERTVGFPVAVQNDQVEADFTDGILTLTLPKVEAAVNRVVKVNLGGQEPAAITGEADAQ